MALRGGGRTPGHLTTVGWELGSSPWTTNELSHRPAKPAGTYSVETLYADAGQRGGAKENPRPQTPLRRKIRGK
jgi:hypothetical protein